MNYIMNIIFICNYKDNMPMYAYMEINALPSNLQSIHVYTITIIINVIPKQFL